MRGLSHVSIIAAIIALPVCATAAGYMDTRIATLGGVPVPKSSAPPHSLRGSSGSGNGFVLTKSFGHAIATPPPGGTSLRGSSGSGNGFVKFHPLSLRGLGTAPTQKQPSDLPLVKTESLRGLGPHGMATAQPVVAPGVVKTESLRGLGPHQSVIIPTPKPVATPK